MLREANQCVYSYRLQSFEIYASIYNMEISPFLYYKLSSWDIMFGGLFTLYLSKDIIFSNFYFKYVINNQKVVDFFKS